MRNHYREGPEFNENDMTPNKRWIRIFIRHITWLQRIWLYYEWFNWTGVWHSIAWNALIGCMLFRKDLCTGINYSNGPIGTYSIQDTWSEIEQPFRKVASWLEIARASIVSHMLPNDSIQSHQAKRALVHRASSLEVPHHLELCHSMPAPVIGLI